MVVNDPAAGAVPPIGGGLANSAVKPAPVTAPEAPSEVNAPLPGVMPPRAVACSVVKAPVFGVVEPIGGGLAKLAGGMVKFGAVSSPATDTSPG